MIIYLFDQEHQVPDDLTVEEFLSLFNYNKHVAIWINGQQIYYREYTSRKLQNKDKVQIIRPIGGG